MDQLFCLKSQNPTVLVGWESEIFSGMNQTDPGCLNDGRGLENHG